MPLNPTGSEIPLSLANVSTTIAEAIAAIDGVTLPIAQSDVTGLVDALTNKAGFVRLTIPPTNADVPSEYELSGSLSFDGTPLTTPITLTYTSENVWENGGSSLLISDGKWQLSHEGFFWQSVESAPATLPEACTFNPTGSNEGTPVFTFTAAVLKTPGQFALVDNNTDDPVLWENLGTDVSPDWKVSSGKADFVRLTANPGTSTSVSYYEVSGGDLAYDGTPVANGPPYLNFVSANRWESGNANEAPGLSSLQISNGYWQLGYGHDPAGTWISNQTTATRPENCTWSGDGDTSGTPILTFFPQTIRAIGQFALVDDGTNPPVMWQNLGNDVTPEWVALAKSSELSTYAPLNSPALTGTPTAPTQAAGNNTTRIATTAFVAAGYQPLDSDLTAIAALTTTSTGRALLTESVAPTGTGALVRASSLPSKTNKVIAHFPLRKTLAPAIGSGVGVFSRNFEGVAEQEDGSYLEYANQTPAYGRYGLGVTSLLFTSVLGFNSPSFSRDLTLSAWAKTNCTVAKTARGIDRTANICTAITATSSNATVLFAVTAASAARTFSAFVKRLSGTGTISITQDGGSTWIDVSDQVAFGVWQRVTLTQTVLNPSVGFRVSTSGDVIAVDGVSCVGSIYPSPPMLTRSSDRQADSISLSSVARPVAGERYLVEMTTRIESESASAPTGITWTNNAGNSFAASLAIGVANRINSFTSSSLLVNQAGNYVPVLGDNLTIGVVAGMGTIEPTINGRRAGVFNDGAVGGDGVSNAGYIMPTGMNTLIPVGGGWISDVKITRLATLNAVSFGDSIANGVTQPLLDRLGPEIVVRQKGVGFATLANMVTRFPFVTTDCFQAKATDNVVVIWGGSNSLAAGVSASAALTDMQTVITGLVNDGWKVCVCTMLDRRAGLSISQGTFDTARAAFNTGLASLTGVTTLIDTANMTNLTNASNGTYFADNIHPTAAGYAIACVGDSTRPGILAAITSFA